MPRTIRTLLLVPLCLDNKRWTHFIFYTHFITLDDERKLWSFAVFVCKCRSKEYNSNFRDFKKEPRGNAQIQSGRRKNRTRRDFINIPLIVSNQHPLYYHHHHHQHRNRCTSINKNNSSSSNSNNRQSRSESTISDSINKSNNNHISNSIMHSIRSHNFCNYAFLQSQYHPQHRRNQPHHHHHQNHRHHRNKSRATISPTETRILSSDDIRVPPPESHEDLSPSSTKVEQMSIESIQNSPLKDASSWRERYRVKKMTPKQSLLMKSLMFDRTEEGRYKTRGWVIRKEEFKKSHLLARFHNLIRSPIYRVAENGPFLIIWQGLLPKPVLNLTRNLAALHPPQN
ncbi:hypothetical protein PoB_001871100 [Plakobranchus ocellatus]|uniref:Uncharacterized protein n=1 Tax=Plakobranchus ocellatus TaxID=259542 RepID=A0AAV3Z8I2_9GAST|nr:hypothetical protein PoB_001871100 [Plakobranchus ocellatus]